LKYSSNLIISFKEQGTWAPVTPPPLPFKTGISGRDFNPNKVSSSVLIFTPFLVLIDFYPNPLLKSTPTRLGYKSNSDKPLGSKSTRTRLGSKWDIFTHIRTGQDTGLLSGPEIPVLSGAFSPCRELDLEFIIFRVIAN